MWVSPQALFFIMGLVEYGIFGAMQSIEWNGSWKRVISVFECFDVFVSDDVGSWKHMETLETCWTYSGFEEWMDCWILVIHLLLHHLSCLKGKEICLCCNCFSWFMVCIVFVGCRSRIFFSLFLVLLLLCCFSCCSSLSSLSTIFPVAVFVLVAVSPGLWTNPAKLPAATCVQQMFTVPIRIIYIYNYYRSPFDTSVIISSIQIFFQRLPKFWSFAGRGSFPSSLQRRQPLVVAASRHAIRRNHGRWFAVEADFKWFTHSFF